jgi:uncharacterized repeat protein (TIGR03803 family)
MQKLTPRRSTIKLPLPLGLLALISGIPCVAADPSILAANTPVLTTLHNFEGVDGGAPSAGLLLASTGALYGTTWAGGTSGWGTIFELIPPGTGGTWTEKTLHNFTGGSDGANPMSNLVINSSGVLYGTTYAGGSAGYGTVFALQPVSGGGWNLKVLHNFSGGTSDGANPAAGLVTNSKGVLYGTTYSGGSSGNGTVFEMVPGSGGVWTETVLYHFKGGTDGANPLAALVLASSGALYGTTYQGGSVTTTCGTTTCTYTNWGTVFQLAPGASGWTENVLYTFTGGRDGGAPESALIIGPRDVLYGSTFWGGTPTPCGLGGYPQGCGTIFQLTPPSASGGSWTQSVLHTFTGQSGDGAHPYRNMALASGKLFGTTFSGGVSDDVCFPASYRGCGTIFSLQPPSSSGGAWTKTNLMIFNGSDGGGPNGALMNKGTLFGTTITGGGHGGYGTVFAMTL